MAHGPHHHHRRPFTQQPIKNLTFWPFSFVVVGLAVPSRRRDAEKEEKESL